MRLHPVGWRAAGNEHHRIIFQPHRSEVLRPHQPVEIASVTRRLETLDVVIGAGMDGQDTHRPISPAHQAIMRSVNSGPCPLTPPMPPRSLPACENIRPPSGRPPFPIDRQTIRADAIDRHAPWRHRIVPATIKAGDAVIFLKASLRDIGKDRMVGETRQNIVLALGLQDGLVKIEPWHKAPQNMSVEKPASAPRQQRLQRLAMGHETQAGPDAWS